MIWQFAVKQNFSVLGSGQSASLTDCDVVYFHPVVFAHFSSFATKKPRIPQGSLLGFYSVILPTPSNRRRRSGTSARILLR
mgnify:CR=1 FL=1